MTKAHTNDQIGARGVAGARAPTSPRAMVWILLTSSAAAMLLVGAAATVVILGDFAAPSTPLGAAFWGQLILAGALTVVSLTLRSLRWIFLLRRAGTRIPIRDAYIGYFAGLSLLLTPFLLGEIAVRAVVHRARAGVPIATTVVVNVWDRVLDLVALALIAGVLGLALGRATTTWNVALVIVGAASFLPIVRRAWLRGALLVAAPIARWLDDAPVREASKLAGTRTWIAALTASIAAWLLPGLAFWGLARASDHAIGIADAEHAYAWSSSLAGLVLSPGGVLVAGRSLLGTLESAGFPPGSAAIAVAGTRLATVGVATALGIVFLFVHLRTRVRHDLSHFDHLADVYDVQLPESRRHALLSRKTEFMREVLAGMNAGRIGLDVGCGQGEHVGRMRELGFDVSGIDLSSKQLQLAAQKLGSAELVRIGSVLKIPAPDATYDFAYIINVLHHLDSLDEQRRAVAELMRVLKPGGLLFIHEINTRNILFRFYMGYVYPSLNCIDEGIERWLLPHRLDAYTSAPVDHVRYFTFLPEFLPGVVVRMLTPIERLLEASPLCQYSAHYMAVLRRVGPASDPSTNRA